MTKMMVISFVAFLALVCYLSLVFFVRGQPFLDNFDAIFYLFLPQSRDLLLPFLAGAFASIAFAVSTWKHLSPHVIALSWAGRRDIARAPSQLHHDSPISQKSQDAFELNERFVKTILPYCHHDPAAPSVVLAVTGSWGSGKSSALRLLARELGSSPLGSPIVVPVNAWVYSNSPYLSLCIYREIVAKLRNRYGSFLEATLHEKTQALATALYGLAESASGGLLRGLKGEPLSSVQDALESFKEEVQKSKKTFVVIVDEIDRLDQDEARAVFKSVKYFLDAPGFVFVLGIDTSHVADERYLEKIFIKQFHVPPIDFDVRKSWLNDKLLSVGPSFMEDSRADQALEICAGVCLTPRSAIRLANEANQLIELHQEHVDKCDLIVFALIVTQYSKVYSKLRSSPEEFASSYFGHTSVLSRASNPFDIRDRSEQLEEKRNWMAELRSLYPEHERKGLEKALEFLFPSTFLREEMLADGENSLTRIYEYNNLLRVLGVYSLEEFSPSEAKEFVAGRASWEETLNEKAAKAQLDVFLQLVAKVITEGGVNLDAHGVSELSVSICNSIYRQWRLRREDSVQSGLVLLLSLLELVKEKTELLERIAVEKPYSLAEKFLLHLARKTDAWKQGAYDPDKFDAGLSHAAFGASPPAIKAAIDAWLTAVTKYMFETGPELLYEEPEPISILFRVGQFREDDYGDVQKWFRSILFEQGRLSRTLLKRMIELHKGSTAESVHKLLGAELMLDIWNSVWDGAALNQKSFTRFDEDRSLEDKFWHEYVSSYLQGKGAGVGQEGTPGTGNQNNDQGGAASDKCLESD